MTELERIKKILVQLKPSLEERFGVQALGIFGSVVRDDATADSDVDIIVHFNKPIGIEFVDLANLLEKKLQKKVDLVSRKGIKEKYFELIQPEILYV
jgi:predicted nucleotidyltransferase